MELPPIVSQEEWQRSHEALLEREKEATRARDALAAERRRQPMTEFAPDHAFEGPGGVVTLADLFGGRRQLLVYHFWFPPDGTPCRGCSMFADQVSPLAHQRARHLRSTSSCATAIACSSRTPRGPWRRGARQRLDVPRPDPPRPSGGVGGHPARPPADAPLPVVAAARRVRDVRGPLGSAQ